MLLLLSKTSSWTYKHVIKPVLFKHKPDDVHNSLLKVGSVVQKMPLVLWFLRTMWAYSNEPVLGQTVDGVHYQNSVVLAAGFDKNFELVKLLKAVGFGGMEGGSITFERCDGNPRPWFYRLPKSQSIVVYAGLANQGVVAVVQRILALKPKSLQDFPINISVAKTNSPEAVTDEQAIADYIGSLKHIKDSGVGDIVTLNISCPNTYDGEPFTTPERLEELLTATDKVQLKQPMYIKMPCNMTWKNFDGLLQVADRHHIAGVTISNLAKDRGQARLLDKLPDSVHGHLGGKATWESSNDMIQHTYKKYHDRFVIIGVGGIFSAEDAYTKIKLGATLVELVTGLIFEGPQLIGQINLGLAKLLEHDGYHNITEAIGADNK